MHYSNLGEPHVCHAHPQQFRRPVIFLPAVGKELLPPRCCNASPKSRKHAPQTGARLFGDGQSSSRRSPRQYVDALLNAPCALGLSSGPHGPPRHAPERPISPPDELSNPILCQPPALRKPLRCSC